MNFSKIKDIIIYFNKKFIFNIQDEVVIVLEESPYFKQIGTIIELPKHPCTWVKIKFIDDKIIAFRNNSFIHYKHNNLFFEKYDQINKKNYIEFNDIQSNNIQINNNIKPIIKKVEKKCKTPIKICNIRCINKYGYCNSCNVKASVSDKFCWNTNCKLSPIYYKYFDKEIINY
jgi:hypothetical protein